MLNPRAKLIIQQLYESMFHEPYMLTEGSHAKINNNPAFMPVVIEKVGRLPGYGEVISIAHYGSGKSQHQRQCTERAAGVVFVKNSQRIIDLFN